MSIDTSILNEAHQHMLLVESGIAEDIILARGYRTETVKANLLRLGFSNRQARVPALLQPIWNVYGEIGLYQIRSDDPRIDKRGKPVKYETPAGSRMTLDVHPINKDTIRDPSIPAWCTEGIKKADSLASNGCCTVGLLGVTAFRGTNEYGGKTALSDWESIALNERPVYIVFDSDVMQKREVYQALTRLKDFLESRGARVLLVYLPSEHGEKVGVDDFLANGKTIDDLQQLATSELRPLPQSDQDSSRDYIIKPEGMFWQKPTKDGPAIVVPLSNFSARIIADIAEDDGVETRRCLQLEACLNHKPQEFTMPASEFSGMNWPMKYLGANAFLSPGPMIKEHARAAIQKHSADIETRRVFTHTGWRDIEGISMFLHGGGAIGPDGPQNGIVVSLPGTLSQYILPDPPSGADRIRAVQSSLQMLNVAPAHLTIPSLAGVTRAVLGDVDFSIYLCGPTGVGKTELVALGQQFFGSGLNARHLPGSWSSTGNSLEAMAFSAKDVVFVVDDFAPTGSSYDVQRAHRDADRTLRAQGNQSGRGRLTADTKHRPTRFPRGLVMATGEDIPKGQSLRARILVLEVGPNDLDWPRLSQCQEEAAAGRYAQAMAGFIQWLASEYGAVRGRLKGEVAAIRERATQAGAHRRTPDIVANLMLGFRYYLAFAHEIGAINTQDQEALEQECWEALGAAAQAQGQHQAASEPTGRFVTLLNAALGSGKAHIASLEGSEPEGGDHEQEWNSPSAFGWRVNTVGKDDFPREVWTPQGDRIGWTAGEFLYLDPEAAFATAQKIGQATGDGLTVTPQTLKKRLKEKGFLITEPSRHPHLTVRKMIEGRRRDVLCLPLSSLTSKKVDQLDQSASTPVNGPLLPRECSTLRGEVDHRVDHTTSSLNKELALNGPLGPHSSLYNDPMIETREGARIFGPLHLEKVDQPVDQIPQGADQSDAQEEVVNLDT